MAMISLLRTSINFHALRFNSVAKIVIVVLMHDELPIRAATMCAAKKDLAL